jgi:hypothetical protein
VREEKMQRVLKTREAIEKQKQDAELRLQKEKEEKSRQIKQIREDRIKEQVQQKKQHAQKKAAEIEERRKQEEAARLAKLKEQVRPASPKLLECEVHTECTVRISLSSRDIVSTCHQWAKSQDCSH